MVARNHCEKLRRIGRTHFKFIIWDTKGEEQDGGNLDKKYIQESNAGLLVFDVTSAASFESLNRWREEFYQYNPKRTPIVLLANKKDKFDYREVDESKMEAWAQGNGAKLFKVSTRTGEGLREAFDEVSKLAVGHVTNVSEKQLEKDAQELEMKERRREKDMKKGRRKEEKHEKRRLKEEKKRERRDRRKEKKEEKKRKRKEKREAEGDNRKKCVLI